MFTVNTEERMIETQGFIDSCDRPLYYIYGKEVAPTTGMAHHQGFICFKNPRSRAVMRSKFPGCFMELADGSVEKNYNYCSKDGDFTEWGEKPADEQGTRTDLATMLDMREKWRKGDVEGNTPLDIYRMNPGTYARCRGYCDLPRISDLFDHQTEWRNVEVICIWGETGSGKTKMVYERHDHAEINKICSYNPEWWNPYPDLPAVLLLDEYEYGALNEDKLRQICDGHPHSLPVKCGFVKTTRVTHVYILSNSDLSIGNWSAPMQRRITEVKEVNL